MAELARPEKSKASFATTLSTRKMKNLKSKIESEQTKDVIELLKLAGSVGDELDYPVYAVGGFVRDLLLGIKNFDIDLTVEGNGVTYAGCFAGKKPGKVVEHPKFGTATIFLNEGMRIDVATSRKELYRRPAALPEIEADSIREDLLRRDFTINALAIRLNCTHFGQLVDLFNGENDIRKGVIRVLHELSLVDDPTRIFRAVRFAHRFGFRIEPATRKLMKDAIDHNMCDRLSGERIRNEIYLLLNEENQPGVIKQMADLGVLKCIHQGLKFGPEKLALLRRIGKFLPEVRSGYDCGIEEWQVFLLGLFYGGKELDKISRRLILSKKERKLVCSLGKVKNIAEKMDSLKAATPGRICRMLKDIPVELLIMIVAAANTGKVKRLVLKYLSDWRKVKTALSGDDLLRMGLEPGPDFKRILDNVLYAKLNGHLKTKQDEVTYVSRNLSPN